jgi:hypothetical protein
MYSSTSALRTRKIRFTWARNKTVHSSAPDNNPPLLEALGSLEKELHKGETRRNRKRMETLLHPDFVEFGRSGIRYSPADVLEASGPNSALPAIHSEHLQMIHLAEGIVLLTYVSSHLDSDGNTTRRTLRSSIWVLTETGWQLRFHQGTPTSAG